jgi:hypothetical protein
MEFRRSDNLKPFDKYRIKEEIKENELQYKKSLDQAINNTGYFWNC